MNPETKKKWAEFFAGMIPGKMARNRWRGILRYGPIRALRLRWRMYRERTVPRIYLAVCAIAKNEGPYFEEWIEWHLGQGVEKFYIYDNDSTDATREVLAPYIERGVVEYNDWPGAKQQLPAYDDCLERHRLDTRWIAVIDLDEFLVPAAGEGSVVSVLKRLEKYPVVEVNWLVYGSGGERAKRPGGVMERFTRHSFPDHELNRHVKSILDPRRVCCMTGCHEAARLTGAAVEANGERVRRNFRDRTPHHEPLRVHHYAIKSYEEFLQKRARGRARTDRVRALDYFDRYDLNDI